MSDLKVLALSYSIRCRAIPETSELITRHSVVSRSLCGNYVCRSLQFENSTAITTATWVKFEQGIVAPWFVVLKWPNVLVLCAPDGSQVETALSYAVDNVWPFALNCNLREGLLFQVNRASTDQPKASFFTMSNHNQNLKPVQGLSQDASERILFVSKGVKPLVVTYSMSQQRHLLWCLLINHPPNTSSDDAGEQAYVLQEIKFAGHGSSPKYHFACGSPPPTGEDTLSENTRASSGQMISCDHATLRTPNAASRVFCVSYRNAMQLCLVLSTSRGGSLFSAVYTVYSWILIIYINILKIF